MTEIVSTPRKQEKLPESPVEAARQRPELNGCRHPVDASSVPMDLQSVGNTAETAANEAEPSERVK